MIYCLASVPLTRTDGRAGDAVSRADVKDGQKTPPHRSQEAYIVGPTAQTDPSLPFKKCAKFNLIRSPDSDLPTPSLPLLPNPNFSFSPLFAVPLALPHSIVETILPSHRLTAAPIGAALRRPPRLMAEPPLLP